MKLKFFIFPILFSTIFTFLYFGIMFSCLAGSKFVVYYFFNCDDGMVMNFISYPFWLVFLLGVPDFKGFGLYWFIGTIIFVMGIVLGFFFQWIYVRIIKQSYTGIK